MPNVLKVTEYEPITTEDVAKASENLSESERWVIEQLDRRAFVDTYSADEMRERFGAYIRGRARRTLEGHGVYVLRWPYPMPARVVRRPARYGGGQKLIGGWWRASFVVVAPWRYDQRYQEMLRGTTVYGGVKVSVWFNPATGRWKVG